MLFLYSYILLKKINFFIKFHKQEQEILYPPKNVSNKKFNFKQGMKNIFFFFTIFIATNSFSQAERKFSTFLSFQINKTLSDRTITNNSAGFGFGLQTLLNTKTRIKPTLEINADLFAGTKELYQTADGKPIDSKSGTIGVYVGSVFQLTENLFLSATIGTSIFNSKAYFGVRPSIGFYPSKRKKWMAKASFTDIFQRDNISNQSFSYMSFALALKLF